MDKKQRQKKASLEALVETGDLVLQILHPGGLALTRELAELCHAGPAKRLLDVASGTGESACYLAEAFGCTVTGVDGSTFMVETAKRKAQDRKPGIQFLQADAHHLPFKPGMFHLVISECTTCALDKPVAVAEMIRVVGSGGYELARIGVLSKLGVTAAMMGRADAVRSMLTGSSITPTAVCWSCGFPQKLMGQDVAAAR